MVKNVISFSLYGNNPLYTLGAIENARISRLVYPNWIPYFFVKDVDKTIIKALESWGAKVIPITHKYSSKEETIAKCTFWRYYPLMDKSIDRVIFRDCDTRLSHREKQAVNEWIASDRKFHLMFDHIQHTTEIMGGMWGAKGGLIPNIKNLIRNYFERNDQYYKICRTYDQLFLKHIIWPNYVKQNYLAHGNPSDSEFHKKKNILLKPYPKSKGFLPTGFNKQTYIGETIYCAYWKEKPNINLLNG